MQDYILISTFKLSLFSAFKVWVRRRWLLPLSIPFQCQGKRDMNNGKDSFGLMRGKCGKRACKFASHPGKLRNSNGCFLFFPLGGAKWKVGGGRMDHLVPTFCLFGTVALAGWGEAPKSGNWFGFGEGGVLNFGNGFGLGSARQILAIF